MYISHYPIQPSDLFPKDLVSGIGAHKSKSRSKVTITRPKTPKQASYAMMAARKKYVLNKTKTTKTTTTTKIYEPPTALI